MNTPFRILAFSLNFIAFPLFGAETAATALREVVPFDAGWRFHRGDAPEAGDALTYARLRPWLLATGAELLNAGSPVPTAPTEVPPGGTVPFLLPDFDDSGWRLLDLPHDWGIEGPFAQELSGETGKLPWVGVGWYRKHFALAAADAGRRVGLELDGAMAYSTIWLNGRLVGGWPYGYSTYRVDLTPHLRIGGDNVLAIRLDNPPDSSRWYPGSGLYRHVRLVKTGELRIAPWGVFVTTPRITAEAATVQVDVTVDYAGAAKATVGVTSRIFALDASGRPEAAPVVVSETINLELDPAKARQGLRTNTVVVAHPLLWDLASPHRYLVETTLEQGGQVVDRVTTPFGIRTIAFDPDRGFLLNGRRVPLQGVCLHHDLGALGTAVNERALERQIDLLQQMGCNAIRTSHNPPAPELLEWCDRKGMLVMDEAFDCWRRGKKWPAGMKEFDPQVRYFDYAKVFDDWHERDLRTLIRRDRNHPSIVLWSIGNEVIEQRFSDGWRLAAHLAGIVREEDRTRPITSGCDNPESGYVGFQVVLDAVGFNYKPWVYAPFHRRQPTLPVFSSESASTLSTRGEYFFPVEPDNKLSGRANFQVSSYDLCAAPWANIPDLEFRGLDENPFAAGEFVWTGFDYLGEPTPYNADASVLLNFSDPAEKERMAAELARVGRIRVPSRSSYFGIIDLAGFPKDRFFLYQARWRPDLPMAHLLPHWNWPERVGQVTPVHVYTSGDEAELFLNGRSLGRRVKGKLEYRLRWDGVVYQPGELKVVVRKNGQPWAEAVSRTTGDPAKLLLEPDRAAVRADGRDLSFVTVKIADAAGDVVPRTHNPIEFELSGPGAIAAVDNGDPTSFEPFQGNTRKAFNGLALVIVRTKAGASGEIVLRAKSAGLVSAEIVLHSGTE